jgi:hypothetical protein
MKKLLAGIFVAVSMTVGLMVATAPAYAATSPTQSAKDQICTGVSGQTGGKCGTGGASINGIISVVLNVLSVIAGILAIIMIVVSGMKYVTSQGEAQAVAGAKKTLIYAIVGLVVVAMAQFIVHYVLRALK